MAARDAREAEEDRQKALESARRQSLAVVTFAQRLAPATIAAPSDAECKAMWAKADTDKNGVLAGDEATKFLEAIKKSGKNYVRGMS